MKFNNCMHVMLLKYLITKQKGNLETAARIFALLK